MTDSAPDRVKEIFHEAVELSPEGRASFLDVACAGDPALRLRVERLLESLEHAGPFLASPTQTSAGAPSGADERRLEPGSMLGARYRIVAWAGSGGMGAVYRAEDLELGQAVALKLIPAATGRDPALLARLRAEVRIARQISHPNVCRVYDIGEADGRHFLSMEWIEGRDLASLLRAEGGLAADRAASVARQICAGLAAAHERGVVHRDLKPANVMVDERGVARITDFGLAEAVAVVRGERAREGTPRYMSPEQLSGGDVGTASDIYSLGLVLYELFTGKAVYTGDTAEQLERQRGEPLAPPSRLARGLDPTLERWILRCLEHDPADRPSHARELLDALPRGAALDGALTRAQQRADRIAAFRLELADLRRAGLLAIDAASLRSVETHHERLLRDLVRDYDVDVAERGKQLSLGMRAVSFVGAFALAASVYYFFYRIWGVISTPLQVAILVAAPIATLCLTLAVAQRERRRTFTSMAGLVAFSCMAANTGLLESTFNLAPAAWPLLAWALFALLLAYACRLRLLLVIGLVVLDAFLASLFLEATGGYWPHYVMRPEGFVPGGLAMLLVGLLPIRRSHADFGALFRVVGLVFIVAPTLFLGMAGWLSYLPLHPRPIEIAYQAIGFAVSATAIGLGIAWRGREVVYTGTSLFVALLFVEFVNWWWAWMPKYLFFLIVALTSIAVVLALKRLRRTLHAALVEGTA